MAEDALDIGAADGVDLAVVLEDLAGDVEGQIVGVHHALDEAQVMGHQLLRLVHDEDATDVELDAMLLVPVPEVPGSALGDEQQGTVLVGTLYPVVDPGQGFLEVMGDVLVELLVLLLRHVGLVAHPQGGALVDPLPLGGLGLLLFLLCFLAVGLLQHLHWQGDMVGELADDGAQPPGLQELLFVLLEMQGDAGAALRYLEGLDIVLAAAIGGPAHAVLGTQAGAPGDEGHLVGDDIGGIETDAKLADEDAVLGLVAGHGLQKASGTGAGNAANGLHDLLTAHADAVVADGQGAGVLVDLDADAQLRGVLQQAVVREGLEAQLLGGVRGVGHQLAEEDLLI